MKFIRCHFIIDKSAGNLTELEIKKIAAETFKKTPNAIFEDKTFEIFKVDDIFVMRTVKEH